MSDPHKHHYAPQFFLRNFAVDAERRKIATVGKNGHMAVWSVRSIERLGYERDFYVHQRNGIPVSVETVINSRIESPISASDTWRKIAEGHLEDLDRSDRAVIYAFIRHLHARTPHALSTLTDLAQLASSRESAIPFDEEERELYAYLRSKPERFREFVNRMATSFEWAEEDFAGCWMRIMRSPLRLRSSTTPVFSLAAPHHPALKLGLPGMAPYILALALSPHALAVLAIGDFDGDFANIEISEYEARGFNRHFLGQFAFFPAIRHLIADEEHLVEDMTWGPYDLLEGDRRKIVFRRRENAPSYGASLSDVRGTS